MNPIWIGLDDTDSRSGGCTTYVAYALLAELIKEDYSVIGYPRLVRLNPNIPWKTRGNGAVSFQVGMGRRRRKIGEKKRRPIFCYMDKTSEECYEQVNFRTIVENIVEKYAQFQDENTNPGFVILCHQPPYELYLKAVRGIVSLKEIISFLDTVDGYYKGYKNGRGLIGATAATAWCSQHDRTYELVAYRDQKRWGSKRIIDDKSVKKMDKTCPSTFDNYDYENRHNRIVPRSPCPVLYGVRGEKSEELFRAYDFIQSEEVEGWTIFETNQGTDEHLEKKNVSDIQPYQSVIAQGKVTHNPGTIEGGHVIFAISDPIGSTVYCAAYEPTKQFRKIIRELCVDDLVEVYGGVRKKPLTVNLEKIRVLHLSEQFEKVGNPVCSVCGKHMKSKGKNQGYTCRTCGTGGTTPLLKRKERAIHTGFYEVPVCARRHLSKPLKRISKNLPGEMTARGASDFYGY